MAWVYYLSMLLVGVVGLAANLVGLPGLWLLAGAFGFYGWLTGWRHFVGWPSFITILALAALAEVLSFVASAAGSNAAGGRKRGGAGAIVGALIGGFTLSFLPIPIVSTIFGACLGAFIGAAVVEAPDRGISHGLRVGVGAAKGQLYGTVAKTTFGVVMLLVAMFVGLPWR